MSSEHDLSASWLTHIIALTVLIALGLSLWRPASQPASVGAEADEKVADMAAVLGESPPSADAIDAGLQSFDRFPPEKEASRALARSLASCDLAQLDFGSRKQLAQQLHAATVVTDDQSSTLPGTMTAIKGTLTTAGCPSAVVEEVIAAARRAARRDPNPRADWW